MHPGCPGIAQNQSALNRGATDDSRRPGPDEAKPCRTVQSLMPRSGSGRPSRPIAPLMGAREWVPPVGTGPSDGTLAQAAYPKVDAARDRLSAPAPVGGLPVAALLGLDASAGLQGVLVHGHLTRPSRRAATQRCPLRRRARQPGPDSTAPRGTRAGKLEGPASPGRSACSPSGLR